MSTVPPLAPRTLLFLPASNPRAIAKARTLAADMVVLDLEDAVRPEGKDSARAAAVAAVREGFGGRLVAVRINPVGTPEHGPDMVALRDAHCDFVVVPKVASARDVLGVASVTARPVLAMIETPAGVLAAAEIATPVAVQGLIAGTNDLRAELGVPPAAGRESVAFALQAIVLAARAGRGWAIDGVFNRLDEPEALAEECRHGRALGFDGKSLIHPAQVEIARAAFGPTPEEIEEARALIAAATGGAERFRDRMIEDMHVAQARALLARAEPVPGAP